MNERIERIKLPAIPVEAYNHLHNEFIGWFTKAKAGEWFTYHYGRDLYENLATKKVKETTWDHACDGKIYLFLKRDTDNPKMFLFLAQKASRKFPHLNPKREMKRG